jgi:hypothetical protein
MFASLRNKFYYYLFGKAQMFTARRETFPGDCNHDVHKMTHSAESERFGLYMAAPSSSMVYIVSHVGIFEPAL